MTTVFSESICSFVIFRKHNWCVLFSQLPSTVFFFSPSPSAWQKCSACSTCWIQANMLSSPWNVCLLKNEPQQRGFFFSTTKRFDYFAWCYVWDFANFSACKQVMGSVSDNASSSTQGCWSLRPTEIEVKGPRRCKAAPWHSNGFLSLINVRCSISLNERYL